MEGEETNGLCVETALIGTTVIFFTSDQYHKYIVDNKHDDAFWSCMSKLQWSTLRPL